MNNCSEWGKLSYGKAASLKSLVGPMFQNCLLVPQIIGVSVNYVDQVWLHGAKKSSGVVGEAKQSFWDSITVLTWYCHLLDKPNEPQLS